MVLSIGLAYHEWADSLFANAGAIAMSLPERFCRVRKHLGLTTRAIGQLLGVSKSLWTHYETGKREPSLSMLRSISDLGFSLEWLVNGTEPMLRSADDSKTPDELVGRPIALVRLIRDMEQVLHRNRSQQLQVWANIIKYLERQPAPVRLNELVEALSPSVLPERLEAELSNLQNEGILASSRGQFRLIRSSLKYDVKGLDLWVVLAARDLLQKHLPVQKSAPSRGKLIYEQISVKSGTAADKVRELGVLWKQWMASLDKVEPQQNSDSIDVILSIIFDSKMEQ